jgi:hypothetical protein
MVTIPSFRVLLDQGALFTGVLRASPADQAGDPQ